MSSTRKTTATPIWKREVPHASDLNAFIGTDNLDAHLGIEFTEIGPDYLKARMPVDHRTRQPYGLLHGGASAALAESLGSTAGGLCVNFPEEGVVGLEINANHIRSVREGYVTGTARPLHLGRKTHVWDIRIVDDTGQLICISRLTLVVIQLGGKE